MASEKAMVKTIRARVNALPHTRIKKLWSTGSDRDVDLLVVTHGIAGFYEIKVPGEQPSEWQYDRLDKWKAAGADVGWFDSVDGCVAHIKGLAARAERAKYVLQALIDGKE